MAGILVQLAISWLLLWLFYKKSLAALGLLPDRSRIIDLCTGFAAALLCCFIFMGIQSTLDSSRWGINTSFTALAAFKSSRWVLVSVLFEELIFRGALLYIAIKKLGILKACILSAACFGVYHWFSFNVFGNPGQMLFIFCITGLWGFMFAMAFAKTRSLYLPIGLHFGWNLITTLVFSTGPLGDQLLKKYSGHILGVGNSLLAFSFQLFALPLFTWWYLNNKRKQKPLENN